MYLFENETIIDINELQSINLCAKELLNLISEIPNYENDKNSQKALIEACEFYVLTILKKTTKNN